MSFGRKGAPPICSCLAGIMLVASVHCPICGLPTCHAELAAIEPTHEADGPEREADARSTAAPTTAVANVLVDTVRLSDVAIVNVSSGTFRLTTGSAPEPSDDPHTHAEMDTRSTAFGPFSGGSTVSEATWLTGHMRQDADRVVMAFDLVGKHRLRGPERSYDGETRTVPDNRPYQREARINLGSDGDIHLTRVYGSIEDTLTMTRASMGTLEGSEGLFPALREILGDPPGWKA